MKEITDGHMRFENQVRNRSVQTYAAAITSGSLPYGRNFTFLLALAAAALLSNFC